MSNIIITGAAGFIGSWLVDKLLNGNHTVIAVDNFNDYYDVKIKKQNVIHNLHNPHYKLYQVDIEDLVSLNKIFSTNRVDLVVHLAARAGVRPSIENPISYVKTNVEGTANVLECMKKYSVKKMIFASSSSVYGNCKAKVFSENLKVSEPISPYAATKLAGEQLVYTYCHLYDMQAVCLRFFTVYGPRQRPDLAINKFSRLIESGQPIDMYGDGNTMRDYTFVKDVVDGICAAIAYDKSQYEIINLGGGEPITLKRMIETIETVLNKKAIIHKKPMQPGDVDKTVCDYSKAKNLLGWVPKVLFHDGIEQFVEWSRTR